MTHWFYLLALVVSIAGTMTLDWRYRLAFWYDFKRTSVTLLIGAIVFIVWDLIAIAQGIFIHGNSPYSLPFTLLPHFPLEEVFFLFLLCYCALMLYRGGQKVWPRI